MNKADQDFIREYCARYGVETTPGPGAPRLNGVEVTGEALCRLFVSAGDEENSFYGDAKVQIDKPAKGKVHLSGGNRKGFYRFWGNQSKGWNILQTDKRAS